MGTKQFGSLFQVLWTRIEAGQLRACVRHWVKERSNRLRLSGYGVQLAIKNTEYKAVDDTKVEEGIMDGWMELCSIVCDTQVLPQVNLSQLMMIVLKILMDSTLKFSSNNIIIINIYYKYCCRERYKDLSTQLDEFRQYLLDKSKELPVLKAWEISGIMNDII